MKFTINRDQLLAPLQQIVRVIDKKQVMPILSNVLVQCHDQRLILIGTDIEIQIVSKLSSCDIIEEGEITIPARKLLDICRLLPSGASMKLEVNGEKAKISSGRGRYSLSTLPAEHFPAFSEKEANRQFVINAGKFKEGLDKTSFCMAINDTRYYLNGLLLQVNHSKIKVIASDGHRLALYEDDMGAETEFDSSIIIPRKAVQELSRLIDDSDAELDIQFSSNFIKVFYKDVMFSSKLIDGRFPDFSKSFNQPFFSPVSINRMALKEALMRVEILSNEKYKGVSFDVFGSLLKLSTHNPEHDEAEEEVAIDYLDEAVSISFNAQYMLDAASNIGSEKATLTIASNASVCFIEEPGQSLFRYVVMPMKM